MNHLGIRCNVVDGKGSVTVIIVLDSGEIHRHNFKSPSVFSFIRNSGEILNWHRENILSLITQFNIQAISIKKTETTDGRISKSAIFKLYLEGVMLSLAGTLGMYNRHFYKNDIKNLLGDPLIFDKSIEEIATSFNKNLCIGNVVAKEKEATKEALLSVLTLQKLISND